MSTLVVTTAATSKRLTTLPALKAELGVATSDLDDMLTLYIDQASDSIQRYLARTLGTETVVETFRGPQEIPTDSALMQGRYPIQSVSSVTVDDVLLDSEYYIVEQVKGFLYRTDASDSLAPWEPASKIVVTYTAGYVLPGEAGRDLPPAIERACLDMAKAAYFAARRDPALKEMDVPGVLREVYWVGASGSEVAGIPGNVASGLDPFRNFVV